MAPSDAPIDVAPLFVLSLPRSGSTMLQRVLAGHPEVSTSPEPWILLPLLWTRRAEDAYTVYSHEWAVTGIGELIGRMDGGEEAYREEIATFVRRLYGRASEPGSRYFLDKTPRYHLVVDELLEMFPDARFVFLWRNPLAVLASTLETWLDGRWRPELHEVDLYDGFANLHAAWMAHRDDPRVQSVRYEDLVADPEANATRLIAGLGLAPDPDLVAKQASVDLGAAIGDPSKRRHEAISAGDADAWVRSLTGPVRTRWCNRYLDWLGAERLADLGYDLDALRAALDDDTSSPGSTADDVIETVKGALGMALELDQLKAKLAKRRAGERPHRHT